MALLILGRRTSRDLFRSISLRLQHDARKKAAEDDAELPSTQRVFGYTGDNLAVVRVAWIQWRKCLRRKSQSCYGVLELLHNCYDGCHHLVRA